MSPAPAGKVALSRTATNRGEAVSECADAANNRPGRTKPDASRVTLRHPWFRMVQADAVGGTTTGVATASQCGGSAPDGIGQGIKPLEGSGLAAGTRKGSRPSRSELAERNHRGHRWPRRCGNKLRTQEAPTTAIACLQKEVERNLKGKRQDPWREANDRGEQAPVPTLRTTAGLWNQICNHSLAWSGRGASQAHGGLGPEASPENAAATG